MAHSTRKFPVSVVIRSQVLIGNVNLLQSTVIEALGRHLLSRRTCAEELRVKGVCDLFVRHLILAALHCLP